MYTHTTNYDMWYIYIYAMVSKNTTPAPAPLKPGHWALVEKRHRRTYLSRPRQSRWEICWESFGDIMGSWL